MSFEETWEYKELKGVMDALDKVDVDVPDSGLIDLDMLVELRSYNEDPGLSFNSFYGFVHQYRYLAINAMRHYRTAYENKVAVENYKSSDSFMHIKERDFLHVVSCMLIEDDKKLDILRAYYRNRNTFIDWSRQHLDVPSVISALLHLAK